MTKMEEFSDAVMSEFTDAIDAHYDKVQRLRKAKVFCDVRFAYRDNNGTHRHWYQCDQNDLAEFVKYMQKSNMLVWVLCQCLNGEHAGEWMFMSATTGVWRKPSERLLSQILYDTFGIMTTGYRNVRKKHEEGLKEVFG